MLKILGINHCRYVGVLKSTGEIYAFNPENSGGFRSAKTEAEQNECAKRAKEYYDSCAEFVRIGDFDVLSADDTLSDNDGERMAREAIQAYYGEMPNVRNCRYCKAPFLPAAPAQEVCKKDECQRKRRAEKMATYRKSKSKK